MSSADKLGRKILNDLGFSDLMMPMVGRAIDQLEGAYGKDDDEFDSYQSCKLLVFRGEDFFGMFDRELDEGQKIALRRLSPYPEKYMIDVYKKGRRDFELEFKFMLPLPMKGGFGYISVHVDFKDYARPDHSIRSEFGEDLASEEIDAILMWYTLKN